MLDVVSITVYNRHKLLNIGSSVAQCKPDFEFLNADALFTDRALCMGRSTKEHKPGTRYGNISEQETMHPDAAFVVTGDFNKANNSFRTIAPKYFSTHHHQHAWRSYTGPLLLPFPGHIQVPPPPTFLQIGSLFRSTPACFQAETEMRSTRPQDSPMLVRPIGRYTTGLF